MSQDDRKYTKPALRQRLKDEIEAGDRGGRPGQWSARKSQLLAREYEQAGGGYHGAKDEAAHHLDRWTEQDWQTEDGKGKAEDSHHMHRYLPKAVWDRLTDAQKREAEESKARAKGQHVEWPEAVRRAMQAVKGGQEPTRQALYEQAKRLDVPGRSRMSKAELQRAVKQAE
ncbi:hypothetical protein [Deinococcus sonorensis]|uniref:DUF5872 domain-containing protein n=2 Tax=Deinococcus sonorensis TaxID=309891 RepID=A0AAU7U9H5_9DEIO